MRYQLRPAELRDVPEISRIYNQSIATFATYDVEPESEEDRLKWFLELERRELPIIIAEDATGLILGWGALTPFNIRPGFRFTAEDAIYIDEGSVGKGIGNLVLARLLELARELRMHTVIAKIDSTNAASLKLHEKFGFEEVGRLDEAGFKNGQWLHVVMMQYFVTPKKL